MIDPENRKRAATALIALIGQQNDRLRDRPAYLKGMLNDAVPDLMHERFHLCAALESPRFVSAFSMGTVNSFQLDSLQQELVTDFQFEPSTAQWCADVWRLALNVPVRQSISTTFACPNCMLPGEAELYWANQRVVCPQCNSQILFSESLFPTIQREGWKRKRLSGGQWALAGSLEKAGQLRSYIRSLLMNEDLRTHDVAEAIGLDDICKALEPNVIERLHRSKAEPNSVYRFGIVRAIVNAMLRPPKDEDVDNFISAVGITGISHSNSMCILNKLKLSEPHGIIFSAEQLYYVLGNCQWNLEYDDIVKLNPKGEQTCLSCSLVKAAP